MKNLHEQIVKHVEEDVKKPYKKLIDKHHMACEDHFYICQTKLKDNDQVVSKQFKK